MSIDHDGVLCDFHSPFLAYTASIGLPHVTPEQLAAGWGAVVTALGHDAVSILDLEREYLDTQAARSRQPIAGAREALQTLHADYRLVIVTARRPRWLEQITRDYVDRHLTGLIDDIAFTGSDDPAVKVDKNATIAALHAVAHIDDDPEHCARVPQGTLPIWFGATIGTAQAVPERAVRAADWSEVLQHLRRV